MATVIGQDSDLVVEPAEEDLTALGDLHARLAEADPTAVAFADGDSVELPPTAKRALRLAVNYLARNLAVAIEPYSQLLTTQRAADLLKVSRPTVIGLLSSGAISHTETPGGHRRIPLSELIAYQERALSDADDDVDTPVEQVRRVSGAVVAPAEESAATTPGSST